MRRRRFVPSLDTLELRLPLSVPPTDPVDAPEPSPTFGYPTIIAPVPPPDPTAPVIA